MKDKREDVMSNKILICGLNGAGKSTLGKRLAEKLRYKFKDMEDYYFPGNDSEYPYESARTRAEVSNLLLEDMKKYDNFVLASVKGDYGDEVMSMFTCTVLISVPKDIRMKRVIDRSFQKFGNRMLSDGDLYEKEKNFFDMVRQRSEWEIENWLRTIHVPIIQVDGTKPVDSNIAEIIDQLN